MRIRLPQPLPPAQQLEPWLRERLPLFEYRTWGEKIIISMNPVSAVILEPTSGGAKVKGAMPQGVGPKVLIGIGFALGGLPGLFMIGLFWLMARADWKRMQRQLDFALQGRLIPAGPGIPADSPYMARGADAILANGGPTSSISPWAPVFPLLAAGCLAILGVFGGAFTAFGASMLGRSGGALAEEQALLDVAEENLEWREAGDVPPTSACPEDALPAGALDWEQCHGCSVSDEHPWTEKESDSQYSEEELAEAREGYAVHERDGRYLTCGSVESFASDVERAIDATAFAREIHRSNQLVAAIAGSIALLLFAVAGLLVLVWRGKNGKLMVLRNRELAEQQRTLDQAAGRRA